jgi:DNA-binding NarL/FixJ family response regulator
MEQTAASPASASTLILDRQPLWLSALQQVLEGTGFDEVRSTTSEAQALQLLREHQPAVLLFEPEACVSATSRFLEAVFKQRPGLKVVVVSDSDDPERIGECLRAGVSAYVLKRAQPQDISMAVRQVFQPSIHLAAPTRTEAPLAAVSVRSDDSAGLTRREREILGLVADGSSNGAVARKLWVTEQTVKFHLSNIYRKLGVSNRTAASRWAHEHDVVAGSAAEPVAVAV